ncbi:MAG: hypothetical protein ACOYOK_09450 [Pseudobdellovibrionaceae bacterium]
MVLKFKNSCAIYMLVLVILLSLFSNKTSAQNLENLNLFNADFLVTVSGVYKSKIEQYELITGKGVIVRVGDRFFVVTSSHLTMGEDLVLASNQNKALLKIESIFHNHVSDVSLVLLKNKNLQTPLRWDEKNQSIVWDSFFSSLSRPIIYSVNGNNSFFTLQRLKPNQKSSFYTQLKNAHLISQNQVNRNDVFQPSSVLLQSGDGVFWVTEQISYPGSSGTALFEITNNRQGMLIVKLKGILSFYNHLFQRTFFSKTNHIYRLLNAAGFVRWQPKDNDILVQQFNAFLDQPLIKHINWYFDKGLRRKLFGDYYETPFENKKNGNGVNLDRGESLLENKDTLALPGFRLSNTQYVGLWCAKNQKEYLLDIQSMAYCGLKSRMINSDLTLKNAIKPYLSQASPSFLCKVFVDEKNIDINIDLKIFGTIKLVLPAQGDLLEIFKTQKILTEKAMELEVNPAGLIFNDLLNNLYLDGEKSFTTDAPYISLSAVNMAAVNVKCEIHQREAE